VHTVEAMKNTMIVPMPRNTLLHAFLRVHWVLLALLVVVVPIITVLRSTG
jgi:hypothetical protein